MSNHALNIGDDPDKGSIRRACVIPHRLTFTDNPQLEHERLGNDTTKDEIKSGKHVPALWHMVTTLYTTLRAPWCLVNAVNTCGSASCGCLLSRNPSITP